jgi:hypothetical protein
MSVAYPFTIKNRILVSASDTKFSKRTRPRPITKIQFKNLHGHISGTGTKTLLPTLANPVINSKYIHYFFLGIYTIFL